MSEQEIADALRALLKARQGVVDRARAHQHEPGFTNDLTAVYAAEQVIHDNAEKWLWYLLGAIDDYKADIEHFSGELKKAMDVIMRRQPSPRPPRPLPCDGEPPAC